MLERYQNFTVLESEKKVSDVFSAPFSHTLFGRTQTNRMLSVIPKTQTGNGKPLKYYNADIILT